MALLEAGPEEGEGEEGKWRLSVCRPLSSEHSEFLRLCELRIGKVKQNIVQHSLFLFPPSLSLFFSPCLLYFSSYLSVLCF